MIRLGLLWLFVAVLVVIATRRWYIALCLLVLLTVFGQHPSMPSTMFGIPGLSPWNASLIVVVIFWLHQRRNDPPRAPTPSLMLVLFGFYVMLIVGTGLVGVVQGDSIKGEFANRFDTQGLLFDGVFNPLKFLIIGVMFFDGVRTRQRLSMGLFWVVGSTLIYGLLMFKTIRLQVFTMDFEDARRLTDKLIGLFANDLAEVLVFGIWSALFVAVLLKKTWHRIFWLVCVALNVASFVVLKSRGGYLACCAVGLVLGSLRWRRILILFPVVAALLWVFVPTLRERVLTGVGASDYTSIEEAYNWDEISAGRLTNLWPPTIEQISHSLVFGHGRFAILREACYEKILAGEGNVPTHPHNSYLEVLLDAGLIGLAICLACSAGIIFTSISLMRLRNDRLVSTVGTTGLIAIVAELAAGISGSSFYPIQSMVPYLCIWGIVFRVYVEQSAQAVRRHVPATYEGRKMSYSAEAG